LRESPYRPGARFGGASTWKKALNVKVRQDISGGGRQLGREDIEFPLTPVGLENSGGAERARRPMGHPVDEEVRKRQPFGLQDGFRAALGKAMKDHAVFPTGAVPVLAVPAAQRTTETRGLVRVSRTESAEFSAACPRVEACGYFREQFIGGRLRHRLGLRLRDRLLAS
jgi:hypothetical protein